MHLNSLIFENQQWDNGFQYFDLLYSFLFNALAIYFWPCNFYNKKWYIRTEVTRRAVNRFLKSDCELSHHTVFLDGHLWMWGRKKKTFPYSIHNIYFFLSSGSASEAYFKTPPSNCWNVLSEHTRKHIHGWDLMGGSLPLTLTLSHPGSLSPI